MNVHEGGWCWSRAFFYIFCLILIFVIITKRNNRYVGGLLQDPINNKNIITTIDKTSLQTPSISTLTHIDRSITPTKMKANNNQCISSGKYLKHIQVHRYAICIVLNDPKKRDNYDKYGVADL